MARSSSPSRHATTNASLTGSTKAKINLHEPICRISPDNAGPIAGATEIASIMLPITRPLACSGTTVMTVVMSSGIMTAVPLAWTMRPSSSTSKPGATAAIAVPRLNRLIAAMKTWRSRNRSMMKPVAGMTTAMVSMKPVVSH